MIYSHARQATYLSYNWEKKKKEGRWIPRGRKDGTYNRGKKDDLKEKERPQDHILRQGPKRGAKKKMSNHAQPRQPPHSGQSKGEEGTLRLRGGDNASSAVEENQNKQPRVVHAGVGINGKRVSAKATLHRRGRRRSIKRTKK